MIHKQASQNPAVNFNKLNEYKSPQPESSQKNPIMKYCYSKTPSTITAALINIPFRGHETACIQNRALLLVCHMTACLYELNNQ